ncbi:hypothetical protein ACWEWD_03200 [Streptomyces tendae]
MSDRLSPSASASVPSKPRKRRGRVLSVVAALAVLGGGLAVTGSVAYGTLAVLGGGLAVTGSVAYGAPDHAGHRDAVREGARDAGPGPVRGPRHVLQPA